LMARGFVSSIQLEVANGAVEQAQANLARARADASAAAARVRRAAADATGMDVRAPVAGVVVMSLAYPGLRVTPTDARPLFQTSNGAEELTLEILTCERIAGLNLRSTPIRNRETMQFCCPSARRPCVRAGSCLIGRLRMSQIPGAFCCTA
jgi:hypothetical protein